MRNWTAALLGLVSLLLGCGSHLVPGSESGSGSDSESGSDPAPNGPLDACGLPEPCSSRVTFEACVGLKYQEHDACYFDALLAEPPSVIRASTVNFCQNPPYVVEYLDIYRWADGTMTCAFGEAELDYVQLDVDPTMPYEVETYDCEFSDLSMFETCLADAQAGMPSTPSNLGDCLDWHRWYDIEIGDPVDPVCR
jgi:hypothetical protein